MHFEQLDSELKVKIRMIIRLSAVVWIAEVY